MFRVMLISLFALVLSACGGSSHETEAAPNISINNAVLRLPAPGQTTGAVYFDVTNKGGADVLLSAATPFSDRVELHTHLNEDGVMKMRQIKTVDIGTEAVTHFKTGGLHVMVFNMNVPDGTAHMPLTLTFAKSGAIDVNVTVGEFGGTQPMGTHNMGNHKVKDSDASDKHTGH